MLSDQVLTAHVIPMSTAKKVYGLPVVNTPYTTCPLDCPLNPNNPEPDTGGCYAAQGHGGGIGNVTNKHMREHTVAEVVGKVSDNPARFIRDRQVGDLVDAEGIPSYSHVFFMDNVAQLARKIAYGYTSAWRWLTRMPLNHYVLNASCYSKQDVSDALDAGWPVTLVADGIQDGEVVESHPDYRYFNCPADKNRKLCHECGVCMRGDRKSVVVFTPHGSGRNQVRKALARQAQLNTSTQE